MITLYVGNLPWETNTAELRQIFSEFGEVKAIRIITDSQTGRSKGFGFVEMPADAAESAQARINGAKLRGRSLIVSLAQPRPGENT